MLALDSDSSLTPWYFSPVTPGIDPRLSLGPELGLPWTFSFADSRLWTLYHSLGFVSLKKTISIPLNSVWIASYTPSLTVDLFDVLLSTPAVYFFFRTFQVVVQLVVVQVVVQPNACAMALIDLPSFLSFKMACFSPKDSSLDFMLVFFKHKCSLHRQNPRLKPRVDHWRF